MAEVTITLKDMVGERFSISCSYNQAKPTLYATPAQRYGKVVYDALQKLISSDGMEEVWTVTMEWPVEDVPEILGSIKRMQEELRQ